MILSAKKILNSKLSIKLRNLFGIKPIAINNLHLSSGYTISDSFLWRTDNQFVTTFKYTDICDLFYGIKNNKVEILFFDKFNHFLKKLKISDLKISNKLILDKTFFGGAEDYGVFNIFHKSDSKFNFTIANRCYIGFSKNGNLSSFVHGNTYVNYKSFNSDGIKSDIIGTSFLKNNNYFVQNYFNERDKIELFFCNPSKTKVNFSIGKKSYSLDKGCSIIVDVSGLNKIEIVSNCYFLRPIIFCYSNGYLDVYHG